MGKDPCRRQTRGLRRGAGGEGVFRHQVEPRPWEATCQPGFSQRERRGPPTAAQGAGLASLALARAGRRRDSESWPVPTSSAVSPGCPGKPLFPGMPCSQGETRVSGLCSLRHSRHPPCLCPHPAELSPQS